MKNILIIENKKDREILRKPLPFFDFAKENKKELKELSRRMRIIMKRANGVGLSANQIGKNVRMFVAEVPEEDGRPKFYAILNPKIVKTSEKKVIEEEGCLSVPETYGAVSRSEKIVLEGQTLEGRKIKIKAWGMLARIFQHEVDHLDGKLFLDRTKEIYQAPRSERLKEREEKIADS